MIITHILLGLLAVGIGVASLRYNYQLVGMTGNVGFFEKSIGAGGTYFGFKLLSLLLIIGGFFYMTGLQDAALRFLLSPFAQLFPRR